MSEQTKQTLLPMGSASYSQSVHPNPVSDGQVLVFRTCVHPKPVSDGQMPISSMVVHGGAVSDGQVCATGVFSLCFGRAGAEGFSSAGRGGPSPEPPAAPLGGNPFTALPSLPFHPPSASKTFRGYSRLRREITSIPPLSSVIFSRKKNAQAHKMIVLRISSYHAAKNPLFSGKQPHNMSFYCDLVIICEGNERAGQIGPASDGQVCDIGVFSHCLGLAGAEGFSSAGRGGPSPEPPAAPPGGNPFPVLLSHPFLPPPVSRTFRGYSRLRREITSFPPLGSVPISRKKNAQAHILTLLRISSSHAAKTH